MVRPDQDKFDQNVKPFKEIDTELEQFCIENNLQIEKNLYRTPCRVLRKPGNPELIFDIYQEGDWRNSPYTADSLYTFGIAAYYQPSDKTGDRYRLIRTLVENVSFSELRLELHKYLEEGLRILCSWTPETILKGGHTLEDLKKESSIL